MRRFLFDPGRFVLGHLVTPSMSFLTRKLQSKSSICMDDFTPNEQTWIMGSFAKVCVRCNSEEELMGIHDKAIEMGLEVYLITDSGRTEFHGQPTRTCLGVVSPGRDFMRQFDG